MSDLGVTKTVYSLVYPDTQRVIRSLWTKGSLGHLDEMYEDAHTKKQDDMHGPLLDGWLNWVSPIVSFDPATLIHRYPTNGSSEAIRDAIDEIGAGYAHRPIVVFKGEYEGYKAIAEARGIDFYEIDRANWRRELHDLIKVTVPCNFFLSQPSAIDGNLWEGHDEFMEYTRYIFPFMRIYLDLCYVGCIAKEYKVRADYANVEKIFFSLSKVFGVYYHRIGGCFSRREMPGLYGNMWFKNLFGLNLGVNLMETFKVYDLPRMYLPVQAAVVESLKGSLGSDLVSSDVILLANRRLPSEPTDLDLQMARGSTVRYCLSARMKKHINDQHRKTPGEP